MFRRKRDVQQPDETMSNVIGLNDLPEPTVDPPPTEPLHPNATWPTPSGITEDEAREYCSTDIKQSPVYDRCLNFTENMLNVIINDCVADIKVSSQIYHTKVDKTVCETAEWQIRTL